jgi:hypothetical protein
VQAINDVDNSGLLLIRAHPQRVADPHLVSGVNSVQWRPLAHSVLCDNSIYSFHLKQIHVSIFSSYHLLIFSAWTLEGNRVVECIRRKSAGFRI